MNGIDAPEIFSYECDDELENGIKAKDVNLVRKYEYIKVRDHILNKRKSWCTEK